MKIALVVGHRQNSPGAYGNAGQSEFEFYREFLDELLPELTERHEYKIFLRADDLSGYTERMKHLHKRIDSWGADASISFHFNASAKQYVNGHEILYCSENGRKLAAKLDELFDLYLNNRDRNIKKRTLKERGGGFLCRGKSTCILIEPFFASHQDKYMNGLYGRNQLKKSLVEFMEYLV